MNIAEVTTQYNHKVLEERVKEKWAKVKVPHKLQDKKKKKFFLLDGPPYLNQVAHVGHVKTTTVKDVWAKFKQMQGFNVWLQPGFDTHGLPTENMVERDLGIKSKKEIEEMGIDKFIEACRNLVNNKEKEWLYMYKQLGAWRGWFDPYLSYQNSYIESGWWTVKRLHDRGMLVRGEKPIFWCPHCESALSGYEVTDSYADVKDPSIFVKFPIHGRENEFIVIWTTTPWTLVGNVAIVVHPNEYYVKAKVGKEILIIAEKRLKVLDDLKMKYEVVEKFLGKELNDLKYDPVFDIPVQQKLKLDQNAHRIVLSFPVMKKDKFQEFVTMEEGSGAVHSAPGHGPEDYELNKHYNMPIISPVDEGGKFTKEAGEFAELFVKAADKIIVEKLEKKGVLLHFSWLIHAYPLCWRCKTPLIYRLSKQWFFKIDTIKSKMIKENEKVRWMPDWGKTRFHNWLIAAVDWCVSQQRYWGIPLPVWICDKCQAIEVIGSVQELRDRSTEKLPKEFDLHRHVVDTIQLTCKNCNSTMKRVKDTMNVWFDSGISPWASFGYPFQNKTDFEKMWPVDLICESQDQIRGWFYSLMFCGIATFDELPYKSVGLMGWVLDEKGDKMSKSLGNVVWASEGIEKLGADVLRLYYCWEVPLWEIQKFSFKTAEEIRRALNILWNSYIFFNTYQMENFKPRLTELKVEDRWILSKLNSLIADVTKNFENFEFHDAGRKLMDFVVNDLSRFYIKLIRDRVWVTESGTSKQTALSVLNEVLITLSKLFAPITPYISEEIYQDLSGENDSVFMEQWPKGNKRFVDEVLEEQMEIAKKIIESSLSARQQTNIKLRWPIGSVIIVSDEKKVIYSVKNLKEILLQLSHAKDISVVKEKPDGEFSEADFDFGKLLISKKLDKKLLEEALIREIVREVQSLRKQNKFNVKEVIRLSLSSDETTNKVLNSHLKDLMKEVGARDVSIGELKGQYKGEIKFEEVKIQIAFDKN